MESENKGYIRTYLQNRSRATDTENQLTVIRDKLADWQWRVYRTALDIRQLPNQELLRSTGNSAQYSNELSRRRILKKKGVDTCIRVTDSLCCMRETNTTL